MEVLRFDIEAPIAAAGTRAMVLVGVVASGNLEVLVERGAPAGRCTIEVNTSAKGFAAPPVACASPSMMAVPAPTLFRCVWRRACA